MLVNMQQMLGDAGKNHYAIGSFNCPNMETALAVVRAAERIGSPVILNHGEGHEPFIALEEIAPVLLSIAQKSRVPVAVHIDHGMTYAFLLRAIRAGFTSIMYDCSMLSFDENVSALKKFVDDVHPLGISVEAELGCMLNNIPHHNGNASADALRNIWDTFTDPEAAGTFAEETGVDALTVSFGSMHGAYIEPPKLDIDRLDRIKAVVGNTALVMHGASGIDLDQIRRAVLHGVSKINYYTAVATAPTEKISHMICERAGDVVFYHEIAKIATEIMYCEALKYIEVMANPGY